MKTLFSRLRRRPPVVAAAPVDSGLATSMLPPDEPPAAPVAWAQRAAELHARAIEPTEAARLLLQRWRGDAPFARLGEGVLGRLAGSLQGAEIDAQRELIRQDEGGDFLLVLLMGHAAIERRPPAGRATRLGEAREGDVLGELALFDRGPRLCACKALTPCTVAVLSATALQQLMTDDPALAAALLASIARRLSLRLRLTSTRLSTLLSAA